MSTNVDGANNLSDASVALDLMKRMHELKRKRKRRTPADAAAEMSEQRFAARQKAAAEALQKAGTAPGSGGNVESINLADLYARFKQLEKQPKSSGSSDDSGSSEQSTTQTNIQYEKRTTEIEISIDVNKPVYGLERINENLAQTDRYLFEFRDGATLTIKDKWSGKSTTIWGDPHVDVDDVEGNMNGDFKDLTGSDRFTTFLLQDGTRLTITALDSGVIEKVDIFKESQHLQGFGMAAEGEDASKLFNKPVQTGDGYESSLARGDVVKAGGDGNDWYTENGLLVWGKTTGPLTYTRPSMSMEVKIKQTIEQFDWSAQIDRWI